MQIVTTGARPDLSTAAMSGEWPLFVLKDPISNQYHETVQRYFPQYDVLVVDGDEVVAHAVVVPVRPTLKASYPLTSMADFATWTRADGLHLDPWIRTHQRLGATVVGPAERSMVVTGTVAEWEKWTGLRFPQPGRYVVPGGLDLVTIDGDRGVYEEPNLWMRHL